jgi:hypothetical protein
MLDTQIKESELFRDYTTVVTDIALARGERMLLQRKSGIATTLTVTKGYGWLLVDNAQIEIKPGRVIDLANYTRKDADYFVSPTSEKGMEILKVETRYVAD